MAASAICLVLVQLFKSVTPYMGYFFMLIYFVAPLTFDADDVTWLNQYLLEGICFFLLFATLIDRLWIISTLEYLLLITAFIAAMTEGFSTRGDYSLANSRLIPFIFFQLVIMSYGC